MLFKRGHGDTKPWDRSLNQSQTVVPGIMSRNRNFGSGDAPNLAELVNQSLWDDLAEKYWSKPLGPGKVNPEVIKNEIWDRIENESFEFRTLIALENLQILEK